MTLHEGAHEHSVIASIVTFAHNIHYHVDTCISFMGNTCISFMDTTDDRPRDQENDATRIGITGAHVAVMMGVMIMIMWGLIHRATFKKIGGWVVPSNLKSQSIIHFLSRAAHSNGTPRGRSRPGTGRLLVVPADRLEAALERHPALSADPGGFLVLADLAYAFWLVRLAISIICCHAEVASEAIEANWLRASRKGPGVCGAGGRSRAHHFEVFLLNSLEVRAGHSSGGYTWRRRAFCWTSIYIEVPAEVIACCFCFNKISSIRVTVFGERCNIAEISSGRSTGASAGDPLGQI